MAEVIDLDALVPAGKRIRLGGREYPIPGDMPLEVYLKIAHASTKEHDNEHEALLELVDAVVSLLAWDSPEVSREAVRGEVEPAIRRLGIRTITNLMNVVYADDEKPEADDPNPPPSS